VTDGILREQLGRPTEICAPAALNFVCPRVPDITKAVLVQVYLSKSRAPNHVVYTIESIYTDRRDYIIRDTGQAS
jgi:hypothetical protein